MDIFSLSSGEAGEEGRGEEVCFRGSPSLRLSPRSFLAESEGQNARVVPTRSLMPVGGMGFMVRLVIVA